MTNARKALSYATAGILFGGAATFALQVPGVAQEEAPQNTEQAVTQAMPPSGAPMSFADLAERLQPAVVNISTSQQVEIQRMPFGRGSPLDELFRRFRGDPPTQDDDGGDEPETREATSLGSGFVISPDGYIVTNNHVVTNQNGTDPVDSVTVTLTDEREYEAEIIGRDPLTDLALLKVQAEGLPYVRFGNSESVRVGDWVVAIGNPFGLGGSVTAGIVSALHRNISPNPYDRYIQTDASINRGNSGGPMFDLQGNVIGINTAIFSPTGGNVGIGFAVPASQAKPVIEQLRTIGRVRRGYLGVSIQNVDDALAASFGLDEDVGEIVANVEPGGPADEAGIQRGDIILSVDGQAVTDDNNLSTIVAGSGIGRTVPVELLRNGERVRLNATLAERPTQEELAAAARGESRDLNNRSDDDNEARAPTLGITLTELTPQIRRQLRLDDDIQGVVVAEASANSDAASKGIGRGSVIVEINRQATRTPAEAAAIVERAREAGRDAVALYVKRPTDAQPVYIGVEMSAPEED
ncbi:protease [Pacificimonas flava]|uniref:Probable periplasmic serine endoprotease DegP-like n=2 Tax=Pacificimonas TaxID=1960290 RepID=A0A219B4Y8_9SPHN|nr:MULTISPECIES: Do family serine endopeptidase [Pacificimonas]MBZ6377036.1 Do family serine endopeptidase [Pacificimonas aurantium]OWV33223.1 protease [Pacificimonas flava]